ncbi:hypothetical protein IKS_01583 [Bacillus cereus VDM062]|nr:hypothetical protein IKS_01583 [Bacillus cereus VDM062]
MLLESHISKNETSGKAVKDIADYLTKFITSCLLYKNGGDYSYNLVFLRRKYFL